MGNRVRAGGEKCAVARHDPCGLRAPRRPGRAPSPQGTILIEAVGDAGIAKVPAVPAPGHGPFAWGESASDALEKAVTLEEVAKMALLTLLLDPAVAPLDRVVRDKHFFRKHGPGAYYGQTGHGQAAPA
ncbi:MAG: class II aldolase/adducin family protein [Actinomycetota bacterium]|nr:class II aldolase/adducin family protein [Actinomycetota bacterium]